MTYINRFNTHLPTEVAKGTARAGGKLSSNIAVDCFPLGNILDMISEGATLKVRKTPMNTYMCRHHVVYVFVVIRIHVQCAHCVVHV